MEVGGSHRISCVNVYIIILHASHVEILYDCGQMANLWPCPLWQHPPPPLTPVLEDNLARTRLPTASCLIGSPCTQTQGGNCSVCTLWFKSGPWFSFVIDSVLWDERRESRARLCGWLISQCLVWLWMSQHVWTSAGLLRWCSRVLFLDSTECLMRICSRVPRETLVKKILNLKLCYFNLFYLTSFSVFTLCYICHVLCRFNLTVSVPYLNICWWSSEEYVLPFV